MKNQGSVLLFGQLHDIADLGHDLIIVLPLVGDQAVGAILDAVLGIGEIAAAFVTQSIQGAIAEQATKAGFVGYLMTGEVFTFFILKKVVVGHISHSVLL